MLPAERPDSKASLGWLISLIALLGGLVWFSNQSLQNNSQFSRSQVWLSLPELLADHFAADPEGRSGWSHLPERFDLLAVAGLILVFAWGWGRAVTRRLLNDALVPMTRLESLYWSLVTGLAVWGTLTLLLGLAGLLSRPIFLATGMVPTLLEAYLLLRHQTRTHDADSLRLWTGLGIACAIAVAPFLLAMLLGSLQPPNDFDVKEYHLEGVKEHYLTERVGFLKHNVYTSFPFLTEMLCLSGMVLRGDWFRGALAGQAVLAAFAPITALGLFIAARRWLGNSAAWFAVLVHLSCPWTYRISIIAYAEGGLACFLLATFIATCRVLEAEDAKSARRWTLLTGLLAGAAAGCKYPGVLTVVIPLGLVVVGAARRAFLRSGLLFSAGVLITFGPWLMKNLCETGNPVYPLAYSVFGGADWDKASHAKWQAGHPLPLKDIDGLSWIYRDTWGRLWDVFLGSDWQSGLYLSLAVAAGFAVWRRRSRVLMLGAIYGVFLFLSWQYLTHRIDRFWVPMLPVLSPGWPLLLLPVHVVFLELVIDPTCTLVFEAEAGSPGLMRQPPRPADARLFAARAILPAVGQGLAVLAACVGVYLWARASYAVDAARSLTFTTLVVGFLGVIVVDRGGADGVRGALRQHNAAFRWVTLATTVMLAVVLLVPAVQRLFRFAPVPVGALALAVGAAAVTVLAIAAVAAAARARLRRATA